MLAFALSPLGRYLLIALAVVAVLSGAALELRHQGAESVRKADAVKQAAAIADVKAHEATAAAISAKASQDLSTQHAEVATRTITLIKKVPVYVDAKADAACTVGSGFVSVFNAAASGQTELPRPPGGSGGPPSGVPLSAVLSATVEDFGIAYDWRAEALTWRKWYADQKAAWDAKR